MQVITENEAIKAFVASCRANNQSVGLVPTMGALHQGHLALVSKAKAENDVVVCTIYVNPTQFNNASDLENYPSTIEQDLAFLTKENCTVAYLPKTADIYPDGVKADDLNFGALEAGMEGKFRPGHFQGMATIVKRLLLAVQPTRAYFGEKDYQQLVIVNELVRRENIDVQIIGCPIVRELDGLAMSSRNVRLSVTQRHAAPVIFETLNELKERVGIKTLNKSLAKAVETINAHPHLAVEYFDIVDAASLKPITNWDDAKSVRAITAVLAGETRLLDNILLY